MADEKYKKITGNYDNKKITFEILNNLIDNEINKIDNKNNLNANFSNFNPINNQYKCRSKYFYGSSIKKQQLWKFDFENIYKKDIYYEIDPIKIALQKSLKLNHYIDENNAIEEIIKMMWKNVLKINRNNHKLASSLEIEVINEGKNSNDKSLMKIFNSKDNNLINSILLNAIKEIQKTSEFIFLTFEDCHKLPILKEWIHILYN